MLTETRQPNSKKTKMPRDERRLSIVEAATRLFAERGFAGVTTRELAATVGVSEPVLYEHFRTKRDLYDAIIDGVAKSGLEEAQFMLASETEYTDDRAYFLRLGNLLVDFLEKHGDFTRLLLYGSLERHELADLSFDRHVRVFYKMLTEHIRKRIAAGTLRECDPLLAARSFVGMVHQYALFEITLGFRLLEMSREDVIAGMVDIFLNGMVRK